ncbi:hypothetical protein BOX15_Mlig014043g2, partial [Macrostomum lignano]
ILSRNGARHMRLPMVLTCGHNVCTECVLSSLRQKSDSWTCRVDGCQVATKYNQPLNKLNTIPVGVLPLDLNLIGMFYSDMLIRLTQKSDVRKSSGDEDRGEASKEFTVPGAGIARDRSACSACKAVQSSVKCAECNDSLFCHSCFREFHNQLGFSHQIEPAVTTQLLKPAEDPVCSSAVSHSSAVPANIFCVTCASLICSACQQSSEHADHSTCEFGQANMRLLRWLLSIADSLESLANRLVESEQTLLSETARLESETTSSLQSEVRADFSILYARLISAENDAVCRLRQSGVLAPLAQQSEQLLAELRRCADWLLPLSLSLKALRSAGSDAIARWCPVKPFDYARLLQLLSSLTNQPVCVLPPNVTAVSSAGASAAASMPQLCRRSDTQPFDLAHFSIASPARLQACPPASLEPGIEHLLANSPAGIFCDSGLLEQPSVQQESLSNPLPKAAVVAEEADSAAPTTMPVPLSTGDAVIPLFLLSPREIWVARYAEQAWLKRTQQLCSQAAKSQLAVQTETVQSGDWVLSRFQSASDWCRAIVTKLNIESAVCDVFFPDYGNSVSNKQIAELLTMPPALCEIPPLAHRISLNNIAPRVMNNGPTSQQQPDQWSTEAVYELQEILVKKCFTGDLIVRIVSQQPGETLVDLLIRVVLHDCDLRFLSVRELLVFANLACYAMPYLHNREASNDLVDTEAPRLFLRSSNIFKGYRFFGSVSAFYSPDEFYVFRCNQGADMDVFEEMQQALQSFCNEDKIGDYTVQHPVANLPVAARYSVDCNWYRGVIESYSPDGISVLFTDYGNREVHKDNQFIKYLTKRFYQPHSMCWRCSMYGVSAGDQSPRMKYRQKQLKDMLQQSHVFNFLCMDTPSTVDPNSDGLPTVPVGVYELNTPVCLNVRLYDEGVYSDMPADALARLVKEAPVPVRSRFVRLNESTGEVTVLPRAQPATRGSRVKASARASANSTASDSNVSDSRSSTPAAAPSVDVEPISENYQLLEPWLAKLVLTGKLDHAACTVTSIVNPGLFYIRPENDIGRAAATELNHLLARFSPRNNNSAPRPLPPDAPPTVLACVRKPNLLWYRCRLLQRSSTADTCTVLLIDSGEEYNTPANAIFEITDNQLASMPPLAVPCRLYGAIPAGGQRWTRTSAEAMRSHLARREYFAHMCALVVSEEASTTAANAEASQQRLAAVDLLLCNSDGQCNRLSSMLRLEGVALRYAEPVPPEAAYQRLAEALQKTFAEKRDENLRLRDAEAAATADALKSSNVAEQMPQCDISAAKEDATPQQMQRQQPNIADEPNSDDEFELNEEFLLKPSDEDGDWVIGDPSPPSAAAPPAAATEDSSASTSTSFVSVTAEAAYSKPEAEVEAEPEAEAEAEAEPEPVVEAEQETEPEADAEPEVEAEADPEAEVEPEAEPEADNAVVNNASTLPKNALSDLPSVRPLGDQFRWPNIQVGPLREPIQAKLSHLDCSDERMVIYMQRSDERSEGLLTALRHALHTVYSAVSYAQYDFDVLVEDWARRSVVFESDGVWCRGRVLNYVREQGLFFLLDIDTGYSKVMPTGNMRPVFNCEGLTGGDLSESISLIKSTPPFALPITLWDLYPTDPEHFDSHTFRDWRPYQKTIGALLTSSAKLRVYIVRKAFCPATNELLLASIVLLPDNREISQELIDGLPWLDRDQKLFKMAYRYDLMDPDRPFVPLPLQPSRYASIGLPPTSEPCPVEATDILDLPCVVSLQLLPLDSAADRPMSDWRRLVNQTYQRLVCGDLYHRLQTEGPRQPPLPEGVDIPCACVAKFSEDGVWYRAEVLLFKEDTMLVYFVDYGNAEYMSLARSECNLRQPLFLDEPCLAVRCRLQGLVRHPDRDLDDLPTRSLSAQVISCLVATGAAHDDNEQQPPKQKQLWLDVKRRYDDGVRQPDVVLYDDAELTASANERLLDAKLMTIRRDYPDDATFDSGFQLV